MPSSAVTTMGTCSALPGSSPTMTATGQKLLLSLHVARMSIRCVLCRQPEGRGKGMPTTVQAFINCLRLPVKLLQSQHTTDDYICTPVTAVHILVV